MGDWGSFGCLKQGSLALERRGHQLFPSTPTLAASAPAVAVPDPPTPAFPLIHIRLVSPTRSPRITSLRSPPNSPVTPKHTIMHLAQDSPILGI